VSVLFLFLCKCVYKGKQSTVPKIEVKDLKMDDITVFNLLAAKTPFEKCHKQLMLFGQFVGSWDIDSVWYEADEVSRRGQGEWHFNWILGGLGIQDVLFAVGADPHQYGTSLRCYDPKADVWRVSWMQPLGGEFVNLIGRRDEENIVLEGAGSDPSRLERWSFTEITRNSFVWLGEVSYDQRNTWELEQKMEAKRRSLD